MGLCLLEPGIEVELGIPEGGIVNIIRLAFLRFQELREPKPDLIFELRAPKRGPTEELGQTEIGSIMKDRIVEFGVANDGIHEPNLTREYQAYEIVDLAIFRFVHTAEIRPCLINPIFRVLRLDNPVNADSALANLDELVFLLQEICCPSIPCVFSSGFFAGLLLVHR